MERGYLYRTKNRTTTVSSLVRSPTSIQFLRRPLKPSRVALNETQITVDGETKWLYVAIGTDSKLLLEIDVFSWRGTDPTAAFLHRLTEEHDVSDTELLTDAGGYLTALALLDLRGGLNYSKRNFIEKWFQTVAMRIGRFHSFWWGSPASAVGSSRSS